VLSRRPELASSLHCKNREGLTPAAGARSEILITTFVGSSLPRLIPTAVDALNPEPPRGTVIHPNLRSGCRGSRGEPVRDDPPDTVGIRHDGECAMLCREGGQT
jgi:hypothetical protein